MNHVQLMLELVNNALEFMDDRSLILGSALPFINVRAFISDSASVPLSFVGLLVLLLRLLQG